MRWAFCSTCRGKDRIMDLVCACDGLFPLPVEEKAISGLSRKALGILGCARGGLFPPTCRGKGNFRAPTEGPGSLQRECLRRPFPSARRGNSYFSAPQEGPGSLRQECSRLPLPLPVEEKASSGLPRKALGVLSGSVRNVLFSLPVEQIAISRGQISGLRWPFPPAKEKIVSKRQKLPRALPKDTKPSPCR